MLVVDGADWASGRIGTLLCYLIPRNEMDKDNLIILTGAPGSGKSTLLRLLRERGCTCVDEPARQIISEQRAIGGSGVSNKDPALFVELMLSRAIARHQDLQDTSKTVIFDRGVADNIAYAALYDLPFDHGWAAAKLYRSNSKVFFAPNWQDIYATDEERTMTFEASAVYDVASKSATANESFISFYY